MAIIKVTGIRKMKGQVEGGQPYDYARFYVTGRLDPTKSDRAGFATVEMKALPEFYADKFLKLPFVPEGLPIDVEVEKIAKGKGESEEMIVKVNLPASSSAIPPKAA